MKVKQILHEHNRTWLVREDGWRFPLDGIYGIDYTVGWNEGMSVRVRAGRVSDELLASLAVLKEVLGEYVPIYIDSAY